MKKTVKNFIVELHLLFVQTNYVDNGKENLIRWLRKIMILK